MNLAKNISLSLSLLIHLLIILLLFTPLTNKLYSLLEVTSNIKKSDAIILLTAGVYTDEIYERHTYQRSIYAKNLYDKKLARKIIVTGGKLKKMNLSLAEITKKLLITLGVKENDILTETNSLNTFQNLKNTIPILKNNNLNSALLVTSCSHMFRSIKIAKKLNLKISPAPVPCYEKKQQHIMLQYRIVLDILREYAALIYYWSKGVI